MAPGFEILSAFGVGVVLLVIEHRFFKERQNPSLQQNIVSVPIYIHAENAPPDHPGNKKNLFCKEIIDLRLPESKI